jgi:hypothetical protein
MPRAAAAEPPTTPQTSTKGAPLRREILTRDPEVQARTKLDEKTVRHYSELMLDGVEFPPLVVFDDGDKLYLADGWHRAAAELAGIDVLPCDVRKGTRRDAMLFCIETNVRHGLGLTRADKQRAVTRLLLDPEWSRWSNREIARITGYSNIQVGRYRDVLSPETVGGPRLAVRAGKVLTVRTDTRTRMPKAPPPATTPEPTQPGAPPDYLANWLYYLQRMTPEQLIRWRNIIKTRVDLTILAEAVDWVMRESAAVGSSQ